MGLAEWLTRCKSIVPEEKTDWIKMVNELNTNLKVVLMPSVTCDAWPIYVLNDLKYGEKIMGYAPIIYMVPLGTHDFWVKPEIEQILNRFYRDEEIPDSTSYYNFSLEEVILLDCCEEKRYICVDGINANGFAAKFNTQNGDIIYVLGIMEAAETFWEEVIQGYEVPVICLVDSGKGLGDWFVETPLYKSIIESKNRNVLPQYYFKGKYISTNAPDDFEWIVDIKESPAYTCVSQLYKTGW